MGGDVCVHESRRVRCSTVADTRCVVNTGRAFVDLAHVQVPTCGSKISTPTFKVEFNKSAASPYLRFFFSFFFFSPFSILVKNKPPPVPLCDSACLNPLCFPRIDLAVLLGKTPPSTSAEADVAPQEAGQPASLNQSLVFSNSKQGVPLSPAAPSAPYSQQHSMVRGHTGCSTSCF